MDGNELPNGSDLDTLKQYVNSTITNFSNNLYPTGSIYITIDKSFNPNNNPIFGTGWVKLPDGYFLSTASNPLINNTQSLPNIKGAMMIDDQVASESNNIFDSAFSFTSNSTVYDCKSDLNSDGGSMIFEASRWCSVYQDTINVKPKSLDVVVWRKGGNISQNVASYTMKTDFNKMKLILHSGVSSCERFVETICNKIGDNSRKYLKKTATFSYSNRMEIVPAGGYIQTFKDSGYRGVWLNTTQKLSYEEGFRSRFLQGEVYADINSNNVNIRFDSIYI